MSGWLGQRQVVGKGSIWSQGAQHRTGILTVCPREQDEQEMVRVPSSQHCGDLASRGQGTSHGLKFSVSIQRLESLSEHSSFCQVQSKVPSMYESVKELGVSQRQV